MEWTTKRLVMPAGGFPASLGSPASPASLSTTVKQSYFNHPAPPASPASSVSTVKPRDLVSKNDIQPSHPTAPPAQPLSPREQFAEYYGFSLPPPPPQPDDPVINSYEYKDAGLKPNPYIIKTSPFTSSESSSSLECWKNGSTCNFCHQNLTSGPLFHPPPQPAPFFEPSSYLVAPSLPPPSERELLAMFNEQFVHSQKRLRLVKSVPSRKGVPLTRKHFLSTPSTLHGFNRRDIFTWVTLQRPSLTTRPWSYDGMRTYPAMQLPPEKEKRIIKKMVEGEEIEVEMEVEVDEVPKKLFNFAPKVVLSDFN